MGEEESSSHGATTHGGKIEGYWWWGLASSAQAVTAAVSYQRGRRSESSFSMPFRAFFVSSLIVGTGATAVAGLLNASGVHKLEDLKNVGKNVRTGMGIPPRETRN
ncbi:hypothetical protein ACHQM5_001502 [Ranunculus cassubicifolius]